MTSPALRAAPFVKSVMRSCEKLLERVGLGDNRELCAATDLWDTPSRKTGDTYLGRSLSVSTASGRGCERLAALCCPTSADGWSSPQSDGTAGPRQQQHRPCRLSACTWNRYSYFLEHCAEHAGGLPAIRRWSSVSDITSEWANSDKKPGGMPPAGLSALHYQ